MAVAGKVAITLSTQNGGAWSANVTYDRLVAVKHNNNLYISRKTVANVEPPNNEFWFLALEGFSGDDIEDIIDGTTQVGNAKTLDGKEAEYFASKGEVLNTSILEKALTVGIGVYNFYLGRGNYTGNDLPSTQYSYGLATVYVPHAAGAIVVLWNQRYGLPPVYNQHNGTSWLGWKTLATSADLASYIAKSEKPTGTYTGNGSATARQIATNGLGNCVLIFRGANSFVLLSQAGYIAFNGTSVVCGTDAYFSTGKIYISSTSELLNTSGISYEYQVL